MFGQLREAVNEGGFLTSLVDKFLEEVPARLAALREAAGRGDAQALMRAAHSLKGCAGTLGARGMAAMCGGLEECGRAGRAAEAVPRLADRQKEFDRVRKALDAELRCVARGRKTA